MQTQQTQFIFKEPVGVVSTGPTTIHQFPKQPEGVISEEQFLKTEGMEASAPARIALLRLLDEDITKKELRAVWKDELQFKGQQFVMHIFERIPHVMGGLFAAFILLSLAFFPIGKIPLAGFLGLSTSQIAGIAGAWIVIAGMLAYFFITELRPYRIAKRIYPIVNQVNEELPAIMAAWRREQRKKIVGNDEMEVCK